MTAAALIGCFFFGKEIKNSRDIRAAAFQLAKAVSNESEAMALTHQEATQALIRHKNAETLDIKQIINEVKRIRQARNDMFSKGIQVEAMRPTTFGSWTRSAIAATGTVDRIADKKVYINVAGSIKPYDIGLVRLKTTSTELTEVSGKPKSNPLGKSDRYEVTSKQPKPKSTQASASTPVKAAINLKKLDRVTVVTKTSIFGDTTQAGKIISLSGDKLTVKVLLDNKNAEEEFSAIKVTKEVKATPAAKSLAEAKPQAKPQAKPAPAPVKISTTQKTVSNFAKNDSVTVITQRGYIGNTSKAGKVVSVRNDKVTVMLDGEKTSQEFDTANVTKDAKRAAAKATAKSSAEPKPQAKPQAKPEAQVTTTKKTGNTKSVPITSQAGVKTSTPAKNTIKLQINDRVNVVTKTGWFRDTIEEGKVVGLGSDTVRVKLDGEVADDAFDISKVTKKDKVDTRIAL